MDIDLKRDLREKLDAIAPEYGMVELAYPSFVRCHGYHMQPLSAADAVEGLTALIDAATGVRIEVEIEGARNGGEWFGGGRVWRASGKWVSEGGRQANGPSKSEDAGPEAEQTEDGEDEDNRTHESWFVKNFWNAFDALSECVICFISSSPRF